MNKIDNNKSSVQQQQLVVTQTDSLVCFRHDALHHRISILLLGFIPWCIGKFDTFSSENSPTLARKDPELLVLQTLRRFSSQSESERAALLRQKLRPPVLSHRHPSALSVTFRNSVAAAGTLQGGSGFLLRPRPLRDLITFNWFRVFLLMHFFYI